MNDGQHHNTNQHRDDADRRAYTPHTKTMLRTIAVAAANALASLTDQLTDQRPCRGALRRLIRI